MSARDRGIIRKRAAIGIAVLSVVVLTGDLASAGWWSRRRPGYGAPAAGAAVPYTVLRPATDDPRVPPTPRPVFVGGYAGRYYPPIAPGPLSQTVFGRRTRLAAPYLYSR